MLVSANRAQMVRDERASTPDNKRTQTARLIEAGMLADVDELEVLCLHANFLNLLSSAQYHPEEESYSAAWPL